MSETKATYTAGQESPRHFLATLVRDGKAAAGPIYVNAVDHMAAGRLAYDALPGVKDSDTIQVWTLAEFDQRRPGVEYAAGNLRFNVPTRPTGEVGEAPPYLGFMLNLNRLELVSLNRGLNLWLAELRQKRTYTDLMGEAGQSVAEAIEIARQLSERIDTMLGVR